MKPKNAIAVLAAWLALVVLVMLVGSGCATGDVAHPVSMGCVDPLASDCSDPSAYPPLTAQLPPWPFPRLLVPLPEEK